jgi:hypothetical protein
MVQPRGRSEKTPITIGQCNEIQQARFVKLWSPSVLGSHLCGQPILAPCRFSSWLVQHGCRTFRRGRQRRLFGVLGWAASGRISVSSARLAGRTCAGYLLCSIQRDGGNRITSACSWIWRIKTSLSRVIRRKGLSPVGTAELC